MDEESNNGRKVGIIIAVVVAVLLLGGGAWYFGFYKPEQEAKEKARQEELDRAAAEKRRREQAVRKKEEYENLIAGANSAFETENWDSAQDLYSRASALFPDQQYPQDQLVIVNGKLDEIAAKSAPGTVEVISSKTGRYYVVVSSSIDGDLAMDYGNKKAAEGNTVKIIEPYGKIRFYRVSTDNFDTMEQAMAASNAMTTDDGTGAWVLKY